MNGCITEVAVRIARSPQSDLWAMYKAMHRALERAMVAQRIGELGQFDNEQMGRLSRFLGRNLNPNYCERIHDIGEFFRSKEEEIEFSGLDLQTKLRDLPSFARYQPGETFEKKTANLLGAVDGFSKQLEARRLPAERPRVELEIIRELLTKLITDAEEAVVI